ncbi:MAG: hypothetical protein IV086_18710 [Hyphomonadaceae bacterium]|nr:hypothetical protein [Hyphomonadaceae bacterium]
MKHATPPSHIARNALWITVLTLLARLAPMLEGVCEARAWRAAARWLKDAEALARRILFAHAVGLAAGMQFAPRDATATSPLSMPGTPAGGGAVHTGFRLRFLARRRRVCAIRRARAEPDYDGARLQMRADALRAACADPLPLALKLARRIARRREMVPQILMGLRRVRPHAALRDVLWRIFAEPPEIFIAQALRPATGADPPSHLTLLDSDVPPLPLAPEGTPAHACASAVPHRREKTGAAPALPLPTRAGRPAWSAS